MKGKFKAVLSTALVVAFLCLSVTNCFSGVLYRDINGDGYFTMEDVKLVLNFVSRVTKPTPEQLSASDINGDGSVDLMDVNILYSYANTNDMEFFVEEMKAQGFPSSYIQYLQLLHLEYPTWTFNAFNTGLDWNEAVAGERSPHSKQLIENNVQSSFMCSCSKCSGVIQEYPRWVSASQEAVEYYMDPRNFLDEKHIFSFESTRFSEYQTIEGVEAILNGTWMHNAAITYFDADGNLKYYTENGVNIKYSEAIFRAARDSGQSAYYLASRIYQEVGGKTATAGGASGENSPFYGIYNYYNIGAYTGARDGLEWANGYMESRTNAPLYASASTTAQLKVTVPAGYELYFEGTSGNFYKVSVIVNGSTYEGFVPKSYVSISTTYGRPWTDPYKSIYYGAIYINEGFSEYQYTNYLQKFNVNAASGNLYYHEYMGNIRAVESESVNTYSAYVDAGLMEIPKVFSIPVFNNMPGSNLDETFPKTSPKLSCTASDEKSVTLSWNAVYGAQGYYLYKYNTSSATYEMIEKTSKTTFKASMGAETSAKFKLYAYYFDALGERHISAASNIVEAAVSTKPVQPPVVTVRKGVAYNLDGDYLNIRSGPGSTYDIISHIWEGDEVIILDKPAAWYHIKFTVGGVQYEGYASADYIKEI